MAREFRLGVVGLGTTGAGAAEVLGRPGQTVVGVEPTAARLVGRTTGRGSRGARR